MTTNTTSRMEFIYTVNTAFEQIKVGDLLYINQIIQPLTPNTYIVHRYSSIKILVDDISNEDYVNGERITGITQSFLEKIKQNATELDALQLYDLSRGN